MQVISRSRFVADIFLCECLFRRADTGIGLAEGAYLAPGRSSAPTPRTPLPVKRHPLPECPRFCAGLSSFPGRRSTSLGLASQGAPGLVMLCRPGHISAVTLFLCCTGNAVLAQEGQATTATASASPRSRRRVRASGRRSSTLHDTRVEYGRNCTVSRMDPRRTGQRLRKTQIWLHAV
jgi:hypothetical protein